MNKAELCDSVARTTGLSKKDAGMAVDATLETIKKNVKKGVQLVGFGSFTTGKRKARIGRNPQTGAEIKIPATKTVRFKAGKDFKAYL